MGKLIMVVMLLTSIVISMPMIHGINGNDTREIDLDRSQMVGHAKQKLSKLHFYFHAIPKGNNPNQALVAQANMSRTSPTGFGTLSIVDYPLTDGPELSSKVVGRAQGFYAAVSMTQLTLFTSFNMIFPDGSSISISGHNPPFDALRELPVTGGSGAFRLAQGVVTFKTYFYDLPSGNASVEVNVLAMHY